MLGEIKLVAFDWSGTLSDDRKPVHQTNTRMSLHYGVLPVEDMEEWLRSTARGPQEYFQERGVNATWDEIWNLYTTMFATVIAEGVKPTMYQDVPETLEYLKLRGRRLAVISAHPQNSLHQEATEYGIAPYFDYIIGSAANKTKAILRASAELQVPQYQMLYVGDTVSDVLAAHKVPTNAIALTRGYHSEDMLRPHNPLAIWPDLNPFRHYL